MFDHSQPSSDTDVCKTPATPQYLIHSCHCYTQYHVSTTVFTNQIVWLQEKWPVSGSTQLGVSDTVASEWKYKVAVSNKVATEWKYEVAEVDSETTCFRNVSYVILCFFIFLKSFF